MLELNLLFLKTCSVFSSTGKVFQHVQPHMYVFTFGVISFDCLLRSVFLRRFPTASEILRMKAPVLIKMERALISITRKRYSILQGGFFFNSLYFFRAILGS